MIQFENKVIYNEYIDKIHQVLINCISANISAFFRIGQYVAINTTDTTTMGYYVIKIFQEFYILQEDITCDRKIITSTELVVKAKYMHSMQGNTKR